MAQSKIPTGALLAIIVKGSKLMKAAKVLTIAKPMLTFGTMTLSMFAYAFWLGPWFAVIFTLLLFIHEMGHVAAMRIKGLGTPSPVFIPFLGAAIFAPKFTNRDDEAFVGYGGPLLGTFAALAVFGIYFLVPRGTDLSAILLASSYAGVFLNLFNLLPISPLDGGRVTQAVGTWFKYIGLFLLAAFSVLLREPMILLIWVLVLSDLTIVPVRIRAILSAIMAVSMAILMVMGYSSQPFWIDILDCVFAAMFVALNVARAMKPELEEPKDARPSLTTRQRWIWTGLYIGLSILLVVALVYQFQFLPRPAG